VRSRCLEPFFTTKGERGTGLGLAMVYGMTQRHNAELEIESSIGRGTTVRVSFPPAQLSRIGPADRPSTAYVRRCLRLLLVDDDPLVSKSLREVLEGEGHDITVADGGQSGIDAFVAAARSREPFTLVITDLGMPNVDGRKVAAAVKTASPRTPVIMLTGWGRRLLAESDVPPHVDRILTKPPKLIELRTALTELTGNATLLSEASGAHQTGAGAE
jgi:CheY-like chemotaxis protein